MEANTTFIGLLKLLFPSLIGSALAVWYKRNDVNWKDSSKCEKILYTIYGILAIVVGCVLGYILGNTVIHHFDITAHWYKVSIFVVSGLCSLKIIDAIVKNSDNVLHLISTGILRIVENFFGKWGGK